MTGLTPSTTYYVRAYAINFGGVAYGNEVSFTTGAALPTVTTGTASSISYNSASMSGNVTNDGGANVTSRGFCWSTSTNPTIANSILNVGTGIGSFNGTITGLTGNTTYYVRAFATNSSGTAYGNEVSFTVGIQPQPLSCTGGTCNYNGGIFSSSLMNSLNYIVASVGQTIDLHLTQCVSVISNQYCSNSYFTNPSSAIVLSYNCVQSDWGGGYIHENIKFNSPGVYTVTAYSSFTQPWSAPNATCTVYIVVNP